MTSEDGAFGTIRARRIVLQGNPEDTAIVESDGTDLKGTSVVVPESAASPPLNTGWRFPNGAISSSTQVATSLSQNYLTYFTPWYVDTEQEITDARVDIDTAGTGAAEVRLGIVEVSGGIETFVTADALVGDLGTVSAATTGIKTISGLSVVLEPGKWYNTVAIANETVQIEANRFNATCFMMEHGSSFFTNGKVVSRILAASEFSGLSDPPPSPTLQLSLSSLAMDPIQFKVVAPS